MMDIERTDSANCFHGSVLLSSSGGFQAEGVDLRARRSYLRQFSVLRRPPDLFLWRKLPLALVDYPY